MLAAEQDAHHQISSVSSSVDSLIDKLAKLTERSSNSIQLHNSLSTKLQHLHENIMNQERSIEQINTQIENSNIYIQHLTSLNLRSEFFEKQLNDFDNQTVIISATKNQGFKEFQDWKQRNLNWRTTETTFENMCLEYTYLNEQLQQANDFPDVSTHTTTTTTTPAITKKRQLSNGYTTDHNNDSASLLDSSSNLFSNILDDTMLTSNDTITDDCLTPNTPLVVPKKRLLKKESFLNVPYNNEALYETPDAEITPIRGFHIHKRRSTSDPVARTDDYSGSRKSGFNFNQPQYQQQQQHSAFNNNLLPSIQETSFDETVVISPKKERPDLRINTTYNYHDFDTANQQNQQQSQIPHRRSTYKRHNSLPETPDLINFQEEYFDTPLDKVDHDFYRTLKNSKQQQQQQQRISSINSSISFGSENQSSLRHFVSYDTGLHVLNKRFGSSSFWESQGNGTNSDFYSTSPLSRPNYSAIQEDQETDGQEYYSDVESEVETLPLPEENQQVDNESYGNEVARPFVLDHLGEPFLRRSRSHESIFSKYDNNSTAPQQTQQLEPFPDPDRHSTSNDLKTQTMKWLTPNEPTVSSSSVKIFDPLTSLSSSTKLFDPFHHPKATSAIVTAKSIQYKPTPGITTTTTNPREVLNSVVTNNPLLSHIQAKRSSIASATSGSEEAPHSTALHHRQNSSMSWLSSSLFTSYSTDQAVTATTPVSPTTSSSASSIFTTSAAHHHRHKFRPGHSTKSSLSTTTTTTTTGHSHQKTNSSASSTSWLTNIIPNSSIVTSETGRYIGQPSSHPVTEADLSEINVCSYAPVSPVSPGAETGTSSSKFKGINGFGFTSLNGSTMWAGATVTSAKFKRSVTFDDTATLNTVNSGKSSSSCGSGRLSKPGQQGPVVRYSGRVSGGVERVLSSRVSHGALRDALDSSMMFTGLEDV